MPELVIKSAIQNGDLPEPKTIDVDQDPAAGVDAMAKRAASKRI